MAIHSHGALWKERGLLTLGNKDIKRAKDILKLLGAMKLPNQIAIMQAQEPRMVPKQTRETKLLIKQQDQLPEGCHFLRL